MQESQHKQTSLRKVSRNAGAKEKKSSKIVENEKKRNTETSRNKD